MLRRSTRHRCLAAAQTNSLRNPFRPRRDRHILSVTGPSPPDLGRIDGVANESWQRLAALPPDVRKGWAWERGHPGVPGGAAPPGWHVVRLSAKREQGLSTLELGG